ncbi:hypothetical protein [Streptomyces sp. NPDC087859]|uniref:hypothetical protein n=1 Tax=Streptomyces sp. NPDC087859 TaxID=3365812 RepID=UPI0038300D8A
MTRHHFAELVFALAPRWEVADLRPRRPPKAAITTAAPHHSFALSADSSTTDNALPTPVGTLVPACRVTA